MHKRFNNILVKTTNKIQQYFHTKYTLIFRFQMQKQADISQKHSVYNEVLLFIY